MEKIYPKGIMTFDPNENAPEFVLGTVIITPEKLIDWCNENSKYLTKYKGDTQIKLNCLKSQKGGIYFTVDTWKPEKKEQLQEQPKEDEGLLETGDLPF